MLIRPQNNPGIPLGAIVDVDGPAGSLIDRTLEARGGLDLSAEPGDIRLTLDDLVDALKSGNYAIQMKSGVASGTSYSLKNADGNELLALEKDGTAIIFGNLIPPSDDSGELGTDAKRFNRVRSKIIISGDYVFDNDIRITEEGMGIAFFNKDDEKIAVLDADGNLTIKGRYQRL